MRQQFQKPKFDFPIHALWKTFARDKKEIRQSGKLCPGLQALAVFVLNNYAQFFEANPQIFSQSSVYTIGVLYFTYTFPSVHNTITVQILARLKRNISKKEPTLLLFVVLYLKHESLLHIQATLSITSSFVLSVIKNPQCRQYSCIAIRF